MLDHNFWKKYFSVYDVLNIVIPYQELLNKLVDELEIKRGDLILDAGSGTGNLAILIKDKGGKVVGVDFIQEGLDLHKKKDNKAIVFQCDLTGTLPFNDDYFDKIVSNNVIYTIAPEKRNAVMKEFYRVLKPGGRIVISNVKEGWKPLNIYLDHIKKDYQRIGLARLILKIFKMMTPTIKMFYYNAKIKKEGGSGNYKFMSPNEQKTLLEESGFKNVSDDILVYANQAILNVGFK